MKWQDTSAARPGFRIYTSEVGKRTYVIQRKVGFGLWRLFVRDNPEKPLRTIFTAETLNECKAQAEWHEEAADV